MDNELKQVDGLLQDLGRPPFGIRSVSGVDDSARLSESVETLGWEPVDAKLSVSDVTGLARRLGGRRLYGNQPLVPLREAIQNGADAIAARHRLEPNPFAGSIDVSIVPAAAQEYLRLEVPWTTASGWRRRR